LTKFEVDIGLERLICSWRAGVHCVAAFSGVIWA